MNSESANNKCNIILNEEMGKSVNPQDFMLNPTQKYVIDLEFELPKQTAILTSIQVMGAPPAMSDYHKWLKENGFSQEMPNPTNEFVSEFYGKRPLWKTELSQGIVVKNCDPSDDDYYIVMECSRKNEGYKYTKIIVTLGGCE